MKSYIADFGANRGQNIEYFLLKADVVIAIEANPILCESISKDYAPYVANGRLIVSNFVVTDNLKSENTSFYVHKTRDVLSSIIKPSNIHEYDVIEVSGRTPGQILSMHLSPMDKLVYAKFDIEGFDSFALNMFSREGWVSDFVSLEAHDIDALVAILNIPDVKGLKLLRGLDVADKYSKATITDRIGNLQVFNFITHSSGPFGQDLDGPWYGKKAFLELFLINGYGWKDIHATTLDVEVMDTVPLRMLFRLGLIHWIRLIWQTIVPYEYRTKLKLIRRKFRILR